MRDATAAMQAEAAARAVTVADMLPRYLAAGKPRGKDAWKPRYQADLDKAAAPGGEVLKRGKGKTKPGHLAALMPVRLVDIHADLIRDWYATESQRAPVQAARVVAMFSGFLRWCASRKEYRPLVNREAARSGELADLLPAKKRCTDALELDQLQPWFAGTDKLRSRAARAYLQALVLTGARREEMAALRWSVVDFRWHKLTLADKVGDRRGIPLTPYLAALFDALPRATLNDGEANPYVFASPLSKSGRIVEPRAAHADVLTDACIPHVSIHGLRRTFALVGEAAGAPAGAIAQVMGHRPSAVAEGYKPRSIDALRPYLAKVETFILERAGIAFDADAKAQGGLRVVSVNS
jgi:integrase